MIFLVAGSAFLGCKWDISINRWYFYFVLLVANYWNEIYLQSHWPLAAKFGTWLANSLQGSDFAYVSYNGRGGG